MADETMEQPAAASASTAVVADATPASADAAESTKAAAGGKKKGGLVRPRGKRGGTKNRTKAQNEAMEAALKSKIKSSSAPDEPAAHALAIAHWHALEKELARADTTQQRKEEIKKEQEALGGLKAYQDASLQGGDKQKGGETGKWCAEALMSIRGGSKEPMRLLDVGAIAGTSYDKFPWCKVSSIDLNPRATHVAKFDFFDLPEPVFGTGQEDQANAAWEADAEIDEDGTPKLWKGQYDVVCLSLVINFVGDLKARGRMLVHAHRYLKPNGLLYVVLPFACVSNSRYLTHERLTEIFSSAGFDVVRQSDSKRLTRWLVRRKSTAPKGKKLKAGEEAQAGWDGKVFKKQEIVKQGKIGLNNFCILLGGEETVQ